MKFLVVFGLIAVALCALFGSTSGFPSSLDENLENLPGALAEQEQGPEVLHVRAKRLSCQIDKAACTVHCWTLGKNTGHCDNGTCKCYNL